MSFTKLSQSSIKKIKRLREYPIGYIARKVKVSRPTVRKYLKEGK